MDTSFVEKLASAAPTPGGGGASAYCGALACALASMVGNLTVGKKTYAQVEPEVYMRLEKLADLRGRCSGWWAPTPRRSAAGGGLPHAQGHPRAA